MVKNYILCMACFCSENSGGDDRRAKFSLVYEIAASKLDGDDVIAVSPLSACYGLSSALPPRKLLDQSNFCKNSSLTIKFRTHVEWNVSNTLKKEL